MIPQVLRENRPFRVYFAGQAVSLVGDQVSLIALPLVGVLVLHATPAQMGYLTTAALLPNLLFSLHAGAWVDRRGRRRQTMIAADLARAALVATIPIAYAFDALTSNRSYRKRLMPDEALEILARETVEGHWDPAIYAALAAMIRKQEAG